MTALEDMREQGVAVRIDHLTKVYKLFDHRRDRLFEELGLTRKKRSHDLYALRDVNFDVKKGETVGIIGVNGSGKSTILKIITGVLGATSGQVLTDGRISALLELGAGFNMEYTGIENIYLNGTMMGFSEKEIDERLDDILKFADIGEFVYQPVKTYSSGMFVRLAFAVAINIDPEILIVDEALSVGDAFFQAKCYHKFEEFRKAGRTILFVSHDLGSVGKYCDRVIVLNKGIKLAEGEPKGMIDLYKKLLVDHGETTTLASASGAVKQGESDADRIAGKPDNQGASGDAAVSAGASGSEASGASDNGAATDAMSIAAIAARQEASTNITGILPVNPNMLEYGEHQAHFTKITVFDDRGMVTNSISKGTLFTIQCRIHFDRDLEEPICAYTFKDLKGTEICGTNTLFEGHDIGPVKAGDEVVVTFRQRMDLQGAEYLLSFGCTGYSGGDFRVFQRLYDALNVTVVSTKNTVGYYDMNSEVEVERIRAEESGAEDE